MSLGRAWKNWWAGVRSVNETRATQPYEVWRQQHPLSPPPPIPPPPPMPSDYVAHPAPQTPPPTYPAMILTTAPYPNEPSTGQYGAFYDDEDKYLAPLEPDEPTETEDGYWVDEVEHLDITTFASTQQETLQIKRRRFVSRNGTLGPWVDKQPADPQPESTERAVVFRKRA